MKRIAIRSMAVWVLILSLLGGMGFFLAEYTMNKDQWLGSQGSSQVNQSPQSIQVDAIHTGKVVDRDGVLLLDIVGKKKIYSGPEELRTSVIHWLGDRQGNISAAVLGNYAEKIAGYDEETELYADSGGKATLTISAQLQLAAQEAMGDHKGTIALMNYKTGEILCSVSTPNYDPDNPPNLSADTTGKYEAVYMNRFTQSKYVPGSIFKIVTTAAALEEIDDIWEQTFTCTGEVDYGTYDVTCEKVHGELDFDSALAQSCNCAFSQIVEQLGKEKLQKYVDKYNVIESVSFDGITTAAGNFDLSDTSRLDVVWSGIGQHKDQVNPCRYLTFISAIANNGREVKPYLMQKITCENRKTYQAVTQYGDRIMSEAVATELQNMLRNNVIEKYGQEKFPDLQVCGKSGTAQAGGGKEPNAMFTGFVMDEEYPIAFFVAIEGGGYGSKTCIPILSQVLQACMDIL